MQLCEVLPTIQTILLLGILIGVLKKPSIRIPFTKDNFTVSSHILETIVEEHKILILNDEIKKLKKEHDIDPNSKTNSIELYNEKYNKLLNKASKEIFRKISPNTLKTLLNFYTRDGLIVHIIFLLKR